MLNSKKKAYTFRVYAFLCLENHSLGEWFQKRLMSIMVK